MCRFSGRDSYPRTSDYDLMQSRALNICYFDLRCAIAPAGSTVLRKAMDPFDAYISHGQKENQLPEAGQH